MCIRDSAKIDLASPNMNMRDPAIYRIMRAHHHRQGDKWCIYPLYDFAHPIQDAIEGITPVSYTHLKALLKRRPAAGPVAAPQQRGVFRGDGQPVPGADLTPHLIRQTFGVDHQPDVYKRQVHYSACWLLQKEQFEKGGNA